MNKLTIDLKNCFGIKALKHEFDFTKRSVYAIYAPNGCMKSSLALTMKDIANPKDRVRPDAISECRILDENGQLLSQDNISVLASYRDPLADVASTAVLLANAQLRAKFNHVNSQRDKAQETLVKQLKSQSDCKLVEKELVSSFLGREPRDSTDLCVAIGRLDRELRDLVDAPYAEIPYDTIFDEKVLQLLQEPAVKADLEDFIAQYDDLISASIYFKRGMFEYYNASTLAKNLEDQGFFKAKHFVTLEGDKRIEVTTRRQLEQLIATEKEKISNDPDLRGRFEKVEKRLTANITFKAFREYILNNKAVLSKMADILNFKQEVWKSYLKTQIVHVNDLMAKYDAAKDENAKIFEQAKQEQTYWESVLETFKDRFVVPFELKVKNRDNIVGGDDDSAELVFSYKDDVGSTQLERSQLVTILSQGEKKALYILDVLFDIKVRETTNQPTLFIIDDIADSFDYKNKYAIIHYLMEISENPNFKMIILTHNFDFFRTVGSRFVGNGQCLIASRNDHGEVRIEKSGNIDNIFIKEWKDRFPRDNEIRIASICFMRNMIEYLKSDQDPDYIKLTALLHWKPGVTSQMMQADLESIFSSTFNSPTPPALNEPIIDVVHREAQDCLNAAPGINLEHKIVLSIAIRLAAEKFMTDRINDAIWLGTITKNQTHKLLQKFRNDFPLEIAKSKVLQKIIIMTPENIHLNAFMYEPIVDISDDHLRKLYRDVLAL